MARPDWPNNLEQQSQRKLYVPFAAGLSAGNPTEIRVLPIVVWQTVLRCVGDIEGLPTELQVPTLRESKVLGHRKVHVAEGWAIVGLEAKVALRQ
jgi:hypothetical protein